MTRIFKTTRHGGFRRLRAAGLAMLAGLTGFILVAVAGMQPASAQQIVLRHFDAADGLGSLSVGALIQDRQGFIWAGTETGLFRYNGLAFERQGGQSLVAYAAIRAVAQQRGADGTMIVGTTSDIFAGDGQHFAAVRAGGMALRVGAGAAFAAAEDGSVLAVAQGGLWRLGAEAGGAWQATAVKLAGIPANLPVNGVHLAPGGTLWLVCGQHLCRETTTGTEVWDEAAGVPADDWLSFLDDRQGRLWVRGTGHLIRLDPGQLRFQAADPPHASISSSFHYAPLTQDASGRVLTRIDGGLARFDGREWQTFTTANGLSPLAVRHLLTDRQGAIWMSNSGRGVSRWLGYDKIESWTAAQGLAAEPVWSMVRSGKTLLISTSGGCSALDTVTSLITPCAITGLPAGEPRQMVATPDGDIWIKYRAVMMHVAKGTTAAVAVAGLETADQMYADPRGGVWFFLADHVLHLPPGAGSSSAPQRIASPVAGLVATGAAMDAAGRLWVAFDNSIFTWAGGVWTRQMFPALPGIGLQDLALDGQVLWAAGDPHGVLRARIVDGHIADAAWVDSPLVNSASVMFARVDSRHRLWVGTEQGVVAYDGRTWQRLGRPDGLVWDDVDDSSFLADPDGSVWIGTGNGLSHLRAVDALLAGQTLEPVLTGIMLGGAPLPEPADSAAGTPVPALPWSADRALTADLAVLNFDLSPAARFGIRLKGTGEDWFVTPDYQVHYGNLDAGNYTLQVVAIDADRGLRSPVAQVHFSVRAPWWRRTGFRLLELAAILALAGGGLHWWTRHISAQRRRAEQQLAEHRVLLHRARHDALTGLLNRGAILDLLAAEVEKAKAGHYPLAVVMIDIDHFKQINDTHGHLAGDEVLRGLAGHIGSQLRATDTLGRYGGEEMLAVMPRLDMASPVAVLERLRMSIAGWTFLHQGLALSVTASLGVTWLQSETDTVESLIERADAALYSAKHGGRDQVTYVPPLAA